MLFCDKLQALRHGAGLTQDEFAARIGVSRQAISKWESGTAYPDLKNLQLLCSFFSVSADGLLNPNAEATPVTAGEATFDSASLGANLKRVRCAKGIAQEVLAEALDVSRQSVSKWENGQATPKTEMLLQMLTALDTSFSELLPCTSTVIAEANTEVTVEADEPPPPPSPKNRRFLLWLLPIAACIVAATVLGAVLFVPFLSGDPFYDCFTELFFDPAAADPITDRWIRDGVEITLGAGENALTLNVKVSDTTVTVGGLNEQPIVLPRKNIREQMDKSYLYPQSGSSMALYQSDYDTLLSVLELFEKETGGTDRSKELQKTLQAIARACEEKLESQTRYGFAKGSFALEKTVTYTVDLQDMTELLDIIAEEIKKNEDFNSLFGTEDLLGESLPHSTHTLDQLLMEIKRDLIAMYKSSSIVFSYTLTAGEWTAARLENHAVEKDKTEYVTVLEVLPVFGEKEVGVNLTVSETTKLEGSSYTLQTAYLYRKQSTDKKTAITLTVESGTETNDSNMSQAYSSKETYTLDYDKTTHTYVLSHKIPEWESESRVNGIWELDPASSSVRFSVALVEEDGEKLFESEALAVSVKALDADGALDGGVELLSMTEEQLYDLYRHLPVKKLDALYKELTGEKMGIAYSVEGMPVTHLAQKNAKNYAKKFEAYLGKDGIAQKIEARQVYLYDDEADIYVLLSYNLSNTVSYSYAYTLTDQHLQRYHEATYKNGSLTVHHVKLTKTVAATCYSTGGKYYECSDCGKGYTVELQMLEHSTEIQFETVVTDDNVTRVAELEICKGCKKCFQINIPHYCAAVMTAKSGGYMMMYSSWGTPTVVSLPDSLTKRYPVTMMLEVTERDARLIRVPYGMKKLGKGLFRFAAELQTLILPATLTEIANEAFPETPALHTIFYCGTEEQWKKVKLNNYKTAWADVEVIFCPDGVTPEMAANSIITESK